MKNKIILIDKLNLITFFISILFYKEKVIFFSITYSLTEKVYLNLLKILKKDFEFDIVDYDTNNEKFKQVISKTFAMTKLNTMGFDDTNIIQNFCRINLYYSLFKINEVEVFYKNKYDIKYVFINYINVLKNLNNLDKFHKKIKFYTWFNSRLNDLPDSSLDKKSLDKRIKDKVKWLLLILKVKLLFKESKYQIDTLYCSDRTYKSNEINNIYRNFDDTKDAFLNVVTNIIYFKNQEKSLYSLEIRSLYSYILYVIKHFFKYRSFFQKYKVVSLYEQFYIFKNMYFMNKLIRKNSIKIIFSVHETMPVTIISYVCSKSQSTISLSATWSLGYFPAFEAGFIKQADIYFLWGEFQQTIFSKSHDCSKYYIKNGYLGDFAVDYFKRTSKKYRNLNYIVLYDNVFYDDLFITQKQVYEFIKTTLEFCKKNDLKLIIKTKYEKTFKNYDNLKVLANKFKEIIIFEYGRADLTPVFNAKMAVGISNSSLVNIASCWGIPSILYDKYNLIDTDNISINCVVAKNIFELERQLNILYNDTKVCKVDCCSKVDSFVDGKALNRIYEYINKLKECRGTKEEKINYANKLYKLKYGKDKVIKNKKEIY
ncbi:MAG: hypothetical protein HWD90_10820 [Campylobacteraceae bacterium]|nr:hypothetical protein [Campylobacteraceae bacterium]